MNAVRFSVGGATLTRVPYIDVLVDAEVVGLTPEQVRASLWAQPTWSEGEQVRVGAAVWIIESDGLRIAVDPAQAADHLLRTAPDAAAHQQSFAAALELAGYPRESIDTVIATHLDGIGMMAWLEDDEWTPFFPNAPVLMSRRELDDVIENGDRGPFRPQGREALLALHAQGVITTVDDEHTVTHDVSTEWTGGHTPGFQLVHIGPDDERATMIGHLALSPLQFGFGASPAHPDPAAAAKAFNGLNDGRLLIGPLWPNPGAARWTDDRIETARSGAVR